MILVLVTVLIAPEHSYVDTSGHGAGRAAWYIAEGVREKKHACVMVQTAIRASSVWFLAGNEAPLKGIYRALTPHSLRRTAVFFNS